MTKKDFSELLRVKSEMPAIKNDNVQVQEDSDDMPAWMAELRKTLNATSDNMISTSDLDVDIPEENEPENWDEIIHNMENSAPLQQLKNTLHKNQDAEYDVRKQMMALKHSTDPEDKAEMSRLGKELRKIQAEYKDTSDELSAITNELDYYKAKAKGLVTNDVDFENNKEEIMQQLHDFK